MKNFANKYQKLENTNLATFMANFEQKNPLNTGDNRSLKGKPHLLNYRHKILLSYFYRFL